MAGQGVGGSPASAEPFAGGGPVPEFDVFLSFRGTDTRENFALPLYHELRDRGINAFIDSESLEKGQRIQELIEYINKTKVFLPIFSKNYAESKWCLKEITEMVRINELDRKERPIIPIFFLVEPSVVKHQKESFEAAFNLHKSTEQPHTVFQWKKALESAAEISSFVFRSKEPELDIKSFVENIGREISYRLSKKPFDVNPIGIDDCVSRLIDKLRATTAYGCRRVGIWGQGGIGKTTIAKVLYDQIHRQFDASCFVSNVRENKDRPEALQKYLLENVFRDQQGIEIYDVDKGKSLLKGRIGSKKILLVLDDVDDTDQLDALIGPWMNENSWHFHPESKIIVTTRDQKVLLGSAFEHQQIYEHKELSDEHALQLFLHHAFGSREPVRFPDLCQKFVEFTGRLPLALKVIGSHLYSCKAREEWEQEAEKMRNVQDEKIFKSLKISYDGLGPKLKCRFLDIACCFIGEEREYPTYFWGGESLDGDIHLTALQQKCLVTMDRNRFRMHDQIRDMGRMIAREEDKELNDPEKHSRIWDAEDILPKLENEWGESNGNVQCMILDHKLQNANLKSIAIGRMSKLRLLQVNYVPIPIVGDIFCDRPIPRNRANCVGEFPHLPDLQWLEWRYCPFESLQLDGSNKLVIADVSHSENLRRVMKENCWKRKRNTEFRKLKVLDLSYCPVLKETPDDFSCMTSLVKLNLGHCDSLVSVHKSIGLLASLRWLNMSGCRSLKKLPDTICDLKGLEYLNFNGCWKLSTLPKRLGNLTALTELYLSRTPISTIPFSIGGCKRLKKLTLEWCHDLKEVPDTIGDLASLEEIIFDLNRALGRLPETIGGMKSLKVFNLVDADKISTIPVSIVLLTSLERLSLWGCKSVNKLPPSIGDMSSLEELVLAGTSLTEVPESLKRLTNLRSLSLSCESLQQVPEWIGSFETLEELLLGGTRFDVFENSNERWVGGANMKRIPESIGFLKKLSKLSLKRCRALQQLPSSVADLCHLKEVYMEECSCIELIPRLHSSLIVLDASNCVSLRKIKDISNLKDLERLYLGGCKELENIDGTFESLRSLETLFMEGCDSLSEEFFAKFSQTTFEHLSGLRIPGTKMRGGPSSSGTMKIRFTFPSWPIMPLRHLHLNLQGDPQFFVGECPPSVPLHVEVMEGDEVVIPMAKKDATYTTDDCNARIICRRAVSFEEDGEHFQLGGLRTLVISAGDDEIPQPETCFACCSTQRTNYYHRPAEAIYFTCTEFCVLLCLGFCIKCCPEFMWRGLCNDL